jgi:hypothetical protein
MRQAKRAIKNIWRKFWIKKYAPSARKILYAYRKRLLYKKVVIIQCCARKFLSRSWTRKKKLSLLPFEAVRASSELCYLKFKLDKSSTKYTFDKVMGGAISDNNYLFVSKMQEKHALSLKILHGESEGFTAYGRAFSKTRVTVAILSLFGTEKGDIVDPIAMEVILRYSYLRPNKSHLSTSEWKNKRFHLVEDLKNILEPTRALSWRIYIQGQLPDRLIAHASMTSLWIAYIIDKTSRSTLSKYRVHTRSPRRYCPCCLEPFATDEEFSICISTFEIVHVKSPVYRTFLDRVNQLVSGNFVCKNSGLLSSWIRYEIFAAAALRLYKECVRFDMNKVPKYNVTLDEAARAAAISEV